MTPNYLFLLSTCLPMLHFPIFKTSLDSLGLWFLECEPEASRSSRASLGRVPTSIAMRRTAVQQQQQLLRSIAGQLLTCCMATVEQLLMFYVEQSAEQLNALVTELTV